MYRYPHLHDGRREQDSSRYRHTSPLGNPALTPEEEYNLRKKIVNRALEALTTEVKDQTIFEV